MTLILAALLALARDRDLRTATVALLLIGTFAASMAPYQSLLAIQVFGLSNAGYGAMLVVASVASVGAALTAGIVTDQRANRRRVALGCASLVLAGITLVWATRATWAFVLVHALVLPVGFSLFGQIFALARLAAEDRDRAEREAILSAIRALFALPFIVVLPLWSVAYGRGVPLLAIYDALLVTSAALLLTVALAWPRDGQTRWRERPSGLSVRAALAEIARPRITARLLMLGGISGAVTLYLALIGLVFENAAGRDTADVARFVGLVAGLEVPFMLAAPLLVGRVGKARMIAVGAALYATFLVLMPVLAPTPAVWLLTIPAAIGGAIVLSLPISYVQDLMADRPGTGSSLMALQKIMGDIACAGAFVIGTALSGYGLAALIGGVLAIAGGLSLVWADRRDPAGTAPLPLRAPSEVAAPVEEAGRSL